MGEQHTHSEAEMIAALDRGRAALDDPNEPRLWWWVSVTDPAKPDGRRFRGVVVLDAPDVPGAVPARMVELGIPVADGTRPLDAMMVEAPAELVAEFVPPDLRCRLLTSRADLAAVGADLEDTDGVPVDEQGHGDG